MKYGLIQHLRYLLNYDRAVVHLQADLNRLPFVRDISPFIVRELQLDDREDIGRWLDIIRDAYDQPGYDVEYAENHIRSHLFLDIQKIFLIMDKDRAVGTISIGTYRNNDKVGGDARIAIRKEYQNKGLGVFLIAYGFHKLRENGIKYGESIISIGRDRSIFLHFKCGFIPQVDRRYIQYKAQTRLFVVRWIVNNKLKRMYKNYLDDFSKEFLVGPG